MKCDLTALLLYSIDALAEEEVVSLADHVEACASCRKRLMDRGEFRAAIMACSSRLNAPAEIRPKSRGQIRNNPGKRQTRTAA